MHSHWLSNALVNFEHVQNFDEGCWEFNPSPIVSLPTRALSLTRTLSSTLNWHVQNFDEGCLEFNPSPLFHCPLSCTLTDSNALVNFEHVQNFDEGCWEFNPSPLFHYPLSCTQALTDSNALVNFEHVQNFDEGCWEFNPSPLFHYPLSCTLTDSNALVNFEHVQNFDEGCWEFNPSPLFHCPLLCTLTDSRTLLSTLNMFKILMRVVESLIHRPCFTSNSHQLSNALVNFEHVQSFDEGCWEFNPSPLFHCPLSCTLTDSRTLSSTLNMFKMSWDFIRVSHICWATKYLTIIAYLRECVCLV